MVDQSKTLLHGNTSVNHVMGYKTLLKMDLVMTDPLELVCELVATSPPCPLKCYINLEELGMLAKFVMGDCFLCLA